MDLRIKIEPPLDTNSVGESHTVTVTVEKNLGAGAGWEALQGATPAVTLTETGGAAVANKTDNCASPGGTNAQGKCTVTFTSDTAGTITGSASLTHTLDGQTITRSTGSAHGGISASSAVKHFVAWTLVWIKHDSRGNLLAGATFEVCKTHGWNSNLEDDPNTQADERFVALAEPHDCDEVTDNTGEMGYAGLDENALGGKFKLSGLTLGKYTIAETAAPTGYSFDPNDVRVVRLSLEHPDNSATSHPDSGVTFVNAKLFRIIVLTCNESTNELVVSSVKLGTGTAIDTIGAVPNGLDLEDADLCDLGGASFGDLDAGEYTLHAKVPKD